MAPAVVLVATLVIAVFSRPALAQSVTLPCTEDADCDTVGATCVSGSCSCGSGRVMTSDLTRCLEGASEWGAACSDAVQCVSRLLVGGTCSRAQVVTSTTSAVHDDQPEDVCQCADGYHYLRGQCWRSVGLGAACRRSENCYANHDGESVTCTDGKCTCAQGFYQREYSSCRRISTEFGQECGIAADCQYPDSDCVDRQCACRQGYTFDKASKACRPEAATTTEAAAAAEAYSRAGGLSGLLERTLEAEWRAEQLSGDGGDKPSVRASDSACSSDADCGAHATCNSGSCVCERGYFRKADGDDLACHPEVLQSCSQDGDCIMKNAVCRKSSGVCSCKGGYVASKDMRLCRKMSRALEWSCLYDEQCGYFGPGALCQTKRCRCSPSTHWLQEQQYCWVSRKVGESCRGAADCSALGEGAECGGEGGDKALCRCRQGFHASADGGACRVDAEGVGAVCEQDEDCVSPHTACPAGTCACIRGYTPDATGRSCVSGVGGPCSQDADCGAKDSQCVASLCACPRGRVASLAGDACLPEVTALNGTCVETAQCGQLNAACSEGICACAEGQHFRDGQCHRKRGLGERCAASGECFLAVAAERAECRNGVCRCGFAFQDADDELDCSAAATAAAGRATLAASTASTASTAALWALLRLIRPFLLGSNVDPPLLHAHVDLACPSVAALARGVHPTPPPGRRGCSTLCGPRAAEPRSPFEARAAGRASSVRVQPPPAQVPASRRPAPRSARLPVEDAGHAGPDGVARGGAAGAGHPSRPCASPHGLRQVAGQQREGQARHAGGEEGPRLQQQRRLRGHALHVVRPGQGRLRQEALRVQGRRAARQQQVRRHPQHSRQGVQRARRLREQRRVPHVQRDAEKDLRVQGRLRVRPRRRRPLVQRRRRAVALLRHHPRHAHRAGRHGAATASLVVTRLPARALAALGMPAPPGHTPARPMLATRAGLHSARQERRICCVRM